MKKTHKIISILIVLAMLLSMVPLSFITSAAAEITPTEPTLTTDKYDVNGDGTNDAVYEITDVSELYWFANLVNTKANSGGNNTANAMLMNNITVNENVIVDGALTSDTSSLNVWTAMGKSTSSSGWYAGCFDGNGKTISGLYVDETNYYRGFIGCLGEGGSIKNLTIADSYFTSTKSSLGAFVGTMGLNSAAVKPVIENCKLTGSIVSGTSYVGGIAGGADYGEIISNCHMYNSTIIGTGDNVGGIVGSAGDYNNETYIRLCSVNGGSVSGANKVGGIIGCGVELSKTKISACCNYGTSVTATTRYAGGILGEDGYCYSCFVTAKVTAPKNKGPFAGYGNHYYSAYDSDIYGEGINHISSKSFTTEEIEAGIATYFLTDTTPSNTVYVLWGQRIGEDKYPSWNPDGNQDYIVYRVDDTENGGYIYYNGDAAAEYEPNEDGIYEIANRSDWYKFAKKAKEDTAIDAVLTANIDFSGVGSDKLANYVIGVDQKAYTGTFDGDGYTVSNLPDATHPLFNIIGNGGELKDLNLSGATVTNTDTVSIAGLVYNNQGTVSNVTVTDVTVSGIYSAGIVYYNYGTVTGCTASDITVTGKTTAGGIVGVNNNGKTIENCHVLSGTVKAENADGYDGHAGGICGSSYGGTIKGCSNGADVSSEASRLETAAGIVGKPATYNDVSVNIIECYNTGDINGSCAGGISGADLTSSDVNISLCYNEGNITGNVAGGIAANGSINATDKIINCYNAGEIKAVGTGAKAGGIVGNHSNSSIQNCHNYGKVISEYLAAPISCTNVDTWHGTDELINNYAIEGNIQAPNISPYLDTAGAASNFDAVVKGSTREEFADGTVTAKLNAGNSETVWYQYTHYPILEERHVHQWSYTSEGTDTIKAECVISGCDLSNNYGGTMSIKAPADLLFNGNSKDAECIYTDWLPAKPAVVYNDVDRVNVTGQDIVASVTAGEATASVSYQIQPREIIASMVTLSKTSVSYNGTEQSTTVTVKYNSSTTLAAGTDYEVMGTTSATDIGTYTVTVIGKGNYTGTVEKTWKINKASIRPQILIDGWSYLDTPNAPTLNENPENGEVTYTYYISGGRRPVMTGTANGAETEGGVPQYAGTYYIGATITETEHYTASTISPTKQFTIAPREVSNPDFEGIQKTYLYDNGNEIKPAFTLKDDLGNVIPESEYTVTYSDNTDAGEATITITDNADGNYNVSGTAKFTIITHQHDWVYTANGNVITATCSNSDGGCTDTNGGTLTISAPAELYADGTISREATVENNLVDTSVDVSDITYSSGSAPKTAGTYTASVTAGGAIATVEFTLSNYAAKVTDEDGNLIGNYKTLADAVTAASASEESTLTLLDDITVTKIQIINSGNFTIDLNGKTLLSESSFALSILSGAHVTIKDSGEGGTVESKATGASAVINYGGLTVESGTIKGDGGIDNRGFLNFIGGTAEGVTYSAINSSGSAGVYGGVMKSENGNGITNNSGGALYVYGGEISGCSGIVNYDTAFLSGGEFKGNSYAAINLISGTVEITGGSFTGTDNEYGSLSGTPYGEVTVDYTEGANLTLKGGEFPNGFTVVHNTTLNALLAEGYFYRDAGNNVINIDDDTTKINGYVKVTKGADLSADAVVNVDNVVYNGAAQEPTVTVTVGGKILTEGKDYNLVFANNINAGTATVTVKAVGQVAGGIVGGGNSNAGNSVESVYTGEITKEFTILKADSSVDVYPEANKLTYNGEAQSLVTAGSSESGTVVYSLDGAEYSVSVPTGTNAGEYTVYYKVEGDSNHNDSDPETVTVTIGKKAVTVSATVPDKIYDGTINLDLSNVIITFDGVVDGDTIEYEVLGGSYFTADAGENIKVAISYDVSGEDVDNYDFNAGMIGTPEANFAVMTKANILPRDIADAQIVLGDALTYNGTEQTQSIAGVTIIGKDVTYTVSGNTATNVGVYELTITGNGNFSGTKTALFTITPKDISGGEVVLGDALEYIGYEQKMTVKSVTVDGMDVTYTASGYIATNVGIYPLTVTGTGNFCGEITVLYEIEVNTSAIDGINTSNVKSTDIVAIEYFLDQLDNAVTDYADEDKLAEWDELRAYCNELLAKEKEITEEYKRIILAVRSYDESTVKSADKDDLIQLNEDIYALALTDNLTEQKIQGLEEAHDKILVLLDKITVISDEIKRIIEEVDKYVFESVKSTDKADIQQLIEDIKALLDTQNITADERTILETADETCNKLIAKIDETIAEVERIDNETNAYDIETVTAEDKENIEQLLADIDVITDTDNLTDDERIQLNGNAETLEALLEKINAVAEEIVRIEDEVNSYDESTIKSSDTDDLNQLKADIKALTDGANLTDGERANLAELDATIDALLQKIEDTLTEIERINEEVNAYDVETVKSSDVQNLGKLVDDIDALLDGENITEEEKAALEDNSATIDALIEKLTEVAEEIARVNEVVNGYDEDTIKSSDSDDLAQLKEDIQAVIDGGNVTENEKTALGEMIADIEVLEDKVEETAKEIERIENAVNGYDEATVKSTDKADLEQLKSDIQKLIESGNVTEEEIAGLEETKAGVGELSDKIDQTQAEIDRINDAVAGYDEATVKSTDKADLEQLKSDIQKLIDSGNVTEEEIVGLEEIKADADTLTDTITETEEKLEEIKEIENNFNPENVSSDDKAAIEEKIAEIEAVNPDNLTEEQKAEYDEIKAGFEALLEEIEAADAQVDEIGVELEMFDEERVTIFSKDEIEALKAKIEELLADTNMGEAEKAKLGEYKAQCDNLIMIINTPARYFSMRLFYFIWDALHWLSSHVVFIFNWIIAMF